MTGEQNQGELAKCGEGITKIEDLAELRSTLEIWVDRAAQAVWKFRRDDDGSFWTTSKVAEKAARDAAKAKANDEDPKSPRPHVTTTARSYVALQYAHCSRGDNSKPHVKQWVECLGKFTANFPMKWDPENGFFEEDSLMEEPSTAKIDVAPEEEKKDQAAKVNTFDVAHLADFFQVAEYADRFNLTPKTLPPLVPEAVLGNEAESGNSEDAPGEEADALPGDEIEALAGGGLGASADSKSDENPANSMASRVPSKLRAAVIEKLTKAIEDCTKPTDGPSPHVGEVRFDDREESAHFFATLHALRGLHALNAPLPSNIGEVVEGARSFAVEQCFYFQRGATHRQDPLRLAFACSIYAIYGDHVDQDLCLAIIEALHQAQQDNGSWPATHPILREKDRPWHIASHEVALCLTWLYFQPKIPDSARPLLISMMRRYLLDAVAPTFFRAPTNAASQDPKPLFDGWQDDHTVGTETTVGWATAIICHFLANFSHVLDDWINRRVIEDLDLQLITGGYIIDDVVGDPAPRWQRDLAGAEAAKRCVAMRGPDGKYIVDEKGCIKTQSTHRDAGEVWPDLPPHSWSRDAADANALAKGIYDEWTDPSLDNAISSAIATLVLFPIFSSPDQRPAKDRYAGLLPGAPGTRKTSLVNKIAKTVMWPKVAVPASLIFAKGFDMMEAQANAVFDRLNHLRRCVIFFDEFEEFFVKRAEHNRPEPADKQRTIAAFTTSAMLPRLQQLHDKRRCLIFLATNGIAKIDSAIKRRGRFDFIIEVNHPGAERLIQFLGNLSEKTKKITKLAQLTDADATKVIETVVKALEADRGNKDVRFAWVEELLGKYQDVASSDYEKGVLFAYNELTRGKDEEDPPKIEDLMEELSQRPAEAKSERSPGPAKRRLRGNGKPGEKKK